MADYWSTLRLASVGGVELDLKSRMIKGGHEFGRHRYQGRGGQDTEPTGRAPLVLSLVVELFAKVDPTHYPVKYKDLVNVLTDDDIGGQIEYIDPLFGVLPMQVLEYSLDENADRRDGGVITMTLEERSTDALDLTVPIIVSRPGPRAVATGREVDQAMPSAQVFDEQLVGAFGASGYPLSGAELEYPMGTIFQNAADDAVTRLTSAAATVDYARGEVDRFRARIDAMLSLPELQAVEQWDLRRSLVVLADAVEQTALEVIAKNGLEAQVSPTTTGTTAHELARQVYGDPSRWLDIVASNGQIRNPLRIGSTTRGPLRVFVPRERNGSRGRFV